MFDEFFSGMLARVKDNLPEAVYQNATQMNLVDGALSAVIQQAVRAFASQLLAQVPMGNVVGSVLGQVAGLFGMAEGTGVGTLIQQALDRTDLDEQLRDALIDGFSRYLRENAGKLAHIAVEALREAAQNRS